MHQVKDESRRPIAGMFRRTAHFAVRACSRANVHPDVISLASILAAAGAAACFWWAGRMPGLLLVAPLLCYLRLWCNMLDGMVAIAAGKASARGEIVNDLPDRVSDVLIFAGVAHSGLCHMVSGYWAAIFALLTAYVGTLGKAAGAQREFGGIMSKPWRMVVLHAGTWATYFALMRPAAPRAIEYAGLTILDWTCAAIVLGCVQTIAVRLARILRTLSAGR
jgi:phosphatidylglycerophosphate synthase